MFEAFTEGRAMAITIKGVVREGLVVPDSPLPEGIRVEITLPDTPPGVPGDLQAEFDAWNRASAEALDLVERLARERKADDPRGFMECSHPLRAGASAIGRSTCSHRSGRRHQC